MHVHGNWYWLKLITLHESALVMCDHESHVNLRNGVQHVTLELYAFAGFW